MNESLRESRRSEKRRSMQSKISVRTAGAPLPST
jgi:hypothetical protein